MPPDRPLSPSALAVLEAIAGGATYGFDVMDATRLPSGTVYPVLSRLAKDGLVSPRWERSEVAHQAKRPPRRYYAVTDLGARTLAAHRAYRRALEGAPETLDAKEA